MSSDVSLSISPRAAHKPPYCFADYAKQGLLVNPNCNNISYDDALTRTPDAPALFWRPELPSQRAGSSEVREWVALTAMILETAVNTTRQSRNRTQTSFNAETQRARSNAEEKSIFFLLSLR